jgi:hypothetical protein
VNQKLAQLRAGVKKQIAENPTSIIILRQPMIDDGYGGQCLDPFGTPTEVILKVRISHEQKGPFNLEGADAGLSTGLGRYIQTDHLADIREGDVFDAIGKTWRVGPVDELQKFGGVHSKQAPLIESAIIETEGSS